MEEPTALPKAGDPDIKVRLRSLIADELTVDESEVLPESRLMEDLGADSLDVVELAMRIEEEFGLSLPDEVIDETRTVDQIYNYVEKGLSSKRK